MKIAIVEDEKRDRDVLTAYLEKYNKERGVEFRFSFWQSGEAFLDAGAAREYSLIFMDIYMGDGMDGIETARRLRETGAEGLIVFLTCSRDDIWRAVQLHDCFDYVDKGGLNYARVEKLLDDASRKLRLREKVLEFSSGKQMIRLSLSGIQFLVSHDKYVIITMKDGSEMRYRITFASISSMLQGESRFLQCNRGILLNMDYVRRASTETFEMADGSFLPLRKSDHTRIMEKYYAYQFEKLNTLG